MATAEQEVSAKDEENQAEAPAGGGGMDAKKIMRLVMGGVCCIAFIFSIATISVPLWSYGEYTIFGRTTEVTIGLWRFNTIRESAKDDDSALKKNDLDKKKTQTWNTIEFNRTAVVLSFLLTFFSTLYYLGATWFVILPFVDIGFGAAYLLMAIFAWAGAGAWGTDMDENVLDGDPWDDTVPCAAGCGLEAWNGIMYFAIGLALIAMGVMALQGSAPGEKADTDRQPVPTEAAAPAPASAPAQAPAATPAPAPAAAPVTVVGTVVGISDPPPNEAEKAA